MWSLGLRVFENSFIEREAPVVRSVGLRESISFGSGSVRRAAVSLRVGQKLPGVVVVEVVRCIRLLRGV